MVRLKGLFGLSCPHPFGAIAKTAMFKIVPDDFFEPNGEQLHSKQRTIKKPPHETRGLFYCMVRLKGFEPLTARFVDAK
jgi:hypothetical protein